MSSDPDLGPFANWKVGSTVYSCPLDDCEWTYVEAPPTMSNLIVPSGGPLFGGIKETVAEMNRQLEAALGEHYESHTPLEYLKTIYALRSKVETLEAEAPEVEHARIFSYTKGHGIIKCQSESDGFRHQD